jgi:hypothetical protein
MHCLTDGSIRQIVFICSYIYMNKSSFYFKEPVPFGPAIGSEISGPRIYSKEKKQSFVSLSFLRVSTSSCHLPAIYII